MSFRYFSVDLHDDPAARIVGGSQIPPQYVSLANNFSRIVPPWLRMLHLKRAAIVEYRVVAHGNELLLRRGFIHDDGQITWSAN